MMQRQGNQFRHHIFSRLVQQKRKYLSIFLAGRTAAYRGVPGICNGHDHHKGSVLDLVMVPGAQMLG